MIYKIIKNKYFINIIRFLVSFYFVYFVINKIDISSLDIINLSIANLIAATFLVFMSLGVAVIRWRNICLSLGIDLNLALASKFCLLPSAVM